MDYKRVYIPKPGTDKKRQLGVPTMEWRIALHMWNNMIHIFVEDSLLESMHGFIPGRGTLSC